MMIERNRLSKNVREQNMSNKTLQKVSRLTLILGTALSMTGCASWFTIGESEYSCQMVGEGTKCTNSWDIYKLTNGGKTDIFAFSFYASIVEIVSVVSSSTSSSTLTVSSDVKIVTLFSVAH